MLLNERNDIKEHSLVTASIMKIIIRDSGRPRGVVRSDDGIKAVKIDVMRSPKIPPGFPSSAISDPIVVGGHPLNDK